MKKIKNKVSKEAQLLAINERVRTTFYKVMAEGKDPTAFNSEWMKLARNFGIHKKYSLKEYEAEVNKLVGKWS
jgi:hypothetical protein